MISELKERTIGKITTVDAYRLEAELLDWVNSFNVNGYDDIYQFIRLNGYVLIRIDTNFIVASISAIREKDSTHSLPTDIRALNKIKAIKVLDLFPMGLISDGEFSFGVSNYPVLYSDVLYVKEKELNKLFLSDKKGNNHESQHLVIGTWTLMDKYKIKIDINNFFGFHSAVLGNTGSGKSCTISAMIQGIFCNKMYPRARFIFLDVNGEYSRAFRKKDSTSSIYDIKLRTYGFNGRGEKDNLHFGLPLNLLTIDEWELLLKASSKAQAPILRNALGLYSLCKEKDEGMEDKKLDINTNKIKTYIFCKITRQLLSSDSSLVVSKIIANLNKFNNEILENSFKIKNYSFEKGKVSTECIKIEGVNGSASCYFGLYFGNIMKLDEFGGALKKLEEENLVDNQHWFRYVGKAKINLIDLEEYIELAISWEEAHGNKQVRDYCSAMITRLKSLANRREFDFFGNKEQDEIEKRAIDATNIDQYIEQLVGDSNICIINFDNIDDEVIEVVSAVLTRIFFDKCKKNTDRNKEPIHLVLDEAHRYVSRIRGKEYFFEANRIFERVAKEARKYGLFLMLSSQRPCELNETVLSQCSNFIIHRIQNPDDLQYIRSMTPFISKAILSQLPSIPQQEALIFGTATNLPVLFKVNDADPLPDSKNNNVVKNWKEEKQSS